VLYCCLIDVRSRALIIFYDVNKYTETFLLKDLIFVDDQMHIASFQKNAQPLKRRTAFVPRCQLKFVLEVNPEWRISGPWIGIHILREITII